jgi:hypothetical protein
MKNKIVPLIIFLSFFTWIQSAYSKSVSSAASGAAASNAAQAVLAELELKKNAPKEVRAETFTGRVISKSSVVSAIGVGTKLTVMDENGLTFVFMITGNTVLVGEDGAVIALDWISQNTKVAVEYTMGRDGTYAAKSVKKLPVLSIKK